MGSRWPGGLFAPGGADGLPSGARKKMLDALGVNSVVVWKRGAADADDA